MKNETLTKIFKFLKNEEDKTAPFKWKVLNNVPLTKENLNIETIQIFFFSFTNLNKISQ